MRLQFTRCETCGAITAVLGYGPDIDNRDMHDQWHASLRGAVRQASSPIGVVYESQLDGI